MTPTVCALCSDVSILSEIFRVFRVYTDNRKTSRTPTQPRGSGHMHNGYFFDNFSKIPLDKFLSSSATAAAAAAAVDLIRTILSWWGEDRTARLILNTIKIFHDNHFEF